MAGGWRVTARMVATAMAASAVSRAAESVRKLLAEAAPPPAPAAPTAPTFLEPPAHLTTAAPMHPDPVGEDRIIAAQAAPGHEFGPTPLVAPSHGIGFRSEPRRREPAAEMPVISRPSGDEPEGRDDVAPAAPVVMPKSVRTAAAFVQDLEDDEHDEHDDESDTDTADQASPEQPAAEPSEPVAQEVEEPSDPVAEPEPQPEPVRALRLTAPAVEDTPITPEPAPVVDELVEPPPADPTPEPEPAIVEEPASVKPKDKKSDKAKRRPKKKDKSKKKDKAKGKHRRHTSAISGTVQSSRGRGLRGMQVTVLDDDEQVIGTAVSGAGGAFVVEDLPAGTYRLVASDEADGDFAAGWHGGKSFDKADSIKVRDGKTRRKAGVTLISAAAIDLEVDVRKKRAILAITVTDRATGTPAEGSVRVSTKQFGTELPLTKGRTAITLFGSAKGSPALSKKVTVDYTGSKHTRPESAKAKLR